ncbi:DUF6325 family protein [Leptolyngbya iicbica]|uniref:DUF1269 domain-containing family protein n=2 Tax=Cyanophyceae TaxID=3028117 RepID=A0A4Q7EAD7_9CYAN|nr:DUF6325 family protein [Leptolyngbya sp. LK]RZM79424.1 hypothetical protein DYY88_11825 [Leptolyngbya sp. LK]
MPFGPVELICIKFPETAITDDITLKLKDLVDRQTIRIVDILFIRKTASGEVTITELDEMTDVDHSLLDPAIAEISGLISEEDVADIGQRLDTDSFAAVMLFENTWATQLRDAVVQADGQLVLSDRIHHSVIEAVTTVKS